MECNLEVSVVHWAVDLDSIFEQTVYILVVHLDHQKIRLSDHRQCTRMVHVLRASLEEVVEASFELMKDPRASLKVSVCLVLHLELVMWDCH